MAQRTIVRSRTSTGTRTRVAAVVAGVLLLGLGAYGFGFMFGANKNQPINARQQANLAPSDQGGNLPIVAVQQCNVLPTTNGGGGRCYPGCDKDADCADTSAIGYVASWQACQTTAAAICGNTANCIAQICGPQTPVCTTKKTCSRPQFSLTEAQCLGVHNDTKPVQQNNCDQTKGNCFTLCTQDSNCVVGQDLYNKCVTDMKSSCTKSAASGPITDAACITKRCGNPPAVQTGSCLPATNGIVAHCATPNSIKSPTACAQTGSTGKVTTVWYGICTSDKVLCTSQSNCVQPKTNTGTWVGLCPHQTTSDQPIMNCTSKDTSSCPQPSKPTSDKPQP